MKRIAICLLVVTLAALPAQAVGPLAFLAKEIVKSIIKSFVEDQLNQMLATAGPCGLPMPGSGALAGMAGALGGRGGMPGIPSILGGGKMPSLPGVSGAGTGAAAGKIGAIAGGMQTMDMTALPPGMAEMMKGQMAQADAMAKEHNADGAGNAGHGAPSTPMDVATAMQAMQNATPLSAAEVDELGTLLERMATAMPSAAPKCKPGEMKAVLAMAADMPMGGGMLRMMLEPLRDMQRKLDEAKDTFARMSEQERGEYVETMATEFRRWDKESRQALLGMVESNFLGMPDDIRTQLLARLKQ